MNLGIVIPAAGRGERMKTEINKQFLPLGDRPVLAHTLQLFYNFPLAKEIVVVVAAEELAYCQNEILAKYNFNSIKLIAGGKTRQQSVYAGLMAFSPAIDYVIIHDGARPLLRKDVLDRTIKALKGNNAVITGVKVKDTIKLSDNQGLVEKTLQRDKLIAVQTPQAFAYDLIVKAHQEMPSGFNVTDDASLIEELGYSVKIIEGSYENIKITTPSDLIYANYILQNRGE